MDSQAPSDDDAEAELPDDEYRLSKLLAERGDLTETIRPGGNIAAEISPAGEIAASQVPDHDLGEEIGRGGMGAVHRATDAGLQRDIALKALTARAAKLPTAAARFEREARALAQLEHPNIVPIHRLGHDENGRPFYTMKLVKGQTLRDVLRGIKSGDPETLGAYPLDRLLNIFRKVCDAIAFAHHQGVIHRDLKPENIMIGEYGEALVMDWGLAKLLNEDEEPVGEQSLEGIANLPSGLDPSGTIPPSISGTSDALTMDGEVVGTPRYMAPEQARGDTLHIDARTDVFALGGMLYEILTLEPAFGGKSTQEVLKRIAAGDLEPPVQRATKVPHCPHGVIPSPLSAIVMRAMEVQREARYPTVMDLAADVDAWTAGFATSVEDIGFVGHLRLLIARHKAITATIALSLVALVWATNLYIQSVRKEKANADAARIRAQGAEAASRLAADRAREAEAEARAAERDAKAANAETQVAHQRTAAEFAKAQIALAGVAYRDRDIHRMTRLLAGCPPEYRDTDWHYLHDRIDETMKTIPYDGLPLDKLVGRRGKFTGFFGASPRALYFIPSRKAECRELDIFPEGTRLYPHSLSLSKNGSVGAILLTGDRIAFFDPRYKRLTGIVKTPPQSYVGIELDGDGSHLYVTRYGRERMQKVTVPSLRPVWTVERSFELFRANPIGKLASDPFDRFVAVHVMQEDHPVMLFDAETGEFKHRAEGEQHFLWRMVFSPDGEMIAAGDYFGRAHVWETRTGNSLARFRSGNARLTSMEFTSSGNLVMLSGNSLDRDIRSDDDQRWLDIWSPRTGVLLKQSLGVPKRTHCLAVDPDRNVVLTGGESIKLWSPPFVPEKLVHRHGYAGGAVAFLGDRILLAPEGRNKNACFRIDGADLVPLVIDSRVNEFPVCNAARTVAFCATQMLSTPGGTNLVAKPAFDPKTKLDRMQLNADGSRLLGLAQAQRLRIARLNDRTYYELSHELSRAGVPFIAATFGKENQVIAIRGNSPNQAQTDTRLELWPADETNPSVSQHSSAGQTTIQSNVDGSLLAVADLAWHVSILRAADLSVVANFRAHDDLIRDLDFHPRRQILATVSSDMSIKLWDFSASPPKLVRTILGPTAEPMDIAFNASGTLLGTAGVERAVRIWDVEELLDAKP